mmetsp:Transcript_1860/g.4195  ORF Transcript_1860/g.4195 Transcript_1860/m.4195 type:complete len:85 (-) Transcript_1860:22-276(-)
MGDPSGPSNPGSDAMRSPCGAARTAHVAEESTTAAASSAERAQDPIARPETVPRAILTARPHPTEDAQAWHSSQTNRTNGKTIY